MPVHMKLAHPHEHDTSHSNGSASSAPVGTSSSEATPTGEIVTPPPAVVPPGMASPDPTLGGAIDKPPPLGMGTQVDPKSSAESTPAGEIVKPSGGTLQSVYVTCGVPVGVSEPFTVGAEVTPCRPLAVQHGVASRQLPPVKVTAASGP